MPSYACHKNLIKLAAHFDDKDPCKIWTRLDKDFSRKDKSKNTKFMHSLCLIMHANRTIIPNKLWTIMTKTNVKIQLQDSSRKMQETHK